MVSSKELWMPSNEQVAFQQCKSNLCNETIAEYMNNFFKVCILFRCLCRWKASFRWMPEPFSVVESLGSIFKHDVGTFATILSRKYLFIVCVCSLVRAS